MKRLIWSAALASAVLWPAVRPAEVAAQTSPALENNQIEILYSEPKPSFFRTSSQVRSAPEPMTVQSFLMEFAAAFRRSSPL